jgi:hypothetical protein
MWIINNLEEATNQFLCKINLCPTNKWQADFINYNLCPLPLKNPIDGLGSK